MNRLYILAQNSFYVHRALQSKALPKFSQLRTIQLTINDLQQQKIPETDKNAAAIKQKKPKISPKITLIGQNQSLSVTSLEEAQKLAKRRDLHLILAQELDTKTQRPTYKLVTSAELLAEELKDLKSDGKSAAGKNTANRKSEKTLTIGSRISDHDLASRQKNICKWLTKHHEVRILIQGGPDDMPNMERICKAIEQSIKEPEVLGKIQQKRSKGSHIKFNIVPTTPLPVSTKETEHTISSKAGTSSSS